MPGTDLGTFQRPSNATSTHHRRHRRGGDITGVIPSPWSWGRPSYRFFAPASTAVANTLVSVIIICAAATC